MKMRIKGDSLRLRVSRSELAGLVRGDRVEETIHFTPGADGYLTYALATAQQAAPVRVRYDSQIVSVLISPEQANIWAREEEIGVYASIDLGAGHSLEVIVEKDFACLDRGDEDNADTFANPHAGAMC